MWSYCALIVGHDGIDSPISMAHPVTRHKTTLRHVSPEVKPRHPSRREKKAATKGNAISFAAVVRSAIRHHLGFISQPRLPACPLLANSGHSG